MLKSTQKSGKLLAVSLKDSGMAGTPTAVTFICSTASAVTGWWLVIRSNACRSPHICRLLHHAFRWQLYKHQGLLKSWLIVCAWYSNTAQTL